MFYLYGITETFRDPVEKGRGIDALPLHYVHSDGLTAVMSAVEALSLAPTPRRLWQHERVVEALMERQPVLPARYSTRYASEEALMENLQACRVVYGEHLKRLAGCVELGFRVIRLWEPEHSGDGMAGTAYPELAASEKNSHTFDLVKRAAAAQQKSPYRGDESLSTMICEALDTVAEDRQIQVDTGWGTLVHAAYLVRKSRLREMQQAMRRLIQAYPHLHFLCTGPWPPYHFVPALGVCRA
jgi:hypothetical protein